MDNVKIGGLGSAKLYTIAWIAALAIECAAAKAMLDERHEEPLDFIQNESDTNSYTWGRIGVHNIVIAVLPNGMYGTIGAAVTASQLAASLPHIRIGLLVGIGAAIPHIHRETNTDDVVEEYIDENYDIRLGDVVVACPAGTSGGVVQYDLAKATTGGGWERAGSLNAPPLVLLSALSNLQSEHNLGESKVSEFLEAMWQKWPRMASSKSAKSPSYTHQGFENDKLFRAEYAHVDNNAICRNCEPSQQVSRSKRDTAEPDIHYGIIASGNTLVKDAVARDRIAQSINAGGKCICYEMEAAGIVSHFPCMVIRGICDYADSHKNDRWQPYASATAAAFAKELLSYVSPKKLETTMSLNEIISLRESVEQLRVNTNKSNIKINNLQETIENSTKVTLFDRLSIATEARYNSYTEGNNSMCLEETRVEVLADIFNWIDGDTASVFWLNGMAGTGKSTISRTLSKTLEMRGYLGASFFFKRGESDRGSLKWLSTTIASDLANRYPSVKGSIIDILTSDINITAKTAREQFKYLVLNPLMRAPDNGRIVLVIDALDECEESELQNLFKIIHDFKDKGFLQIKLLLTSRPDLPVLAGFASIKSHYDHMILHNISTSIVEQDIHLFLSHEFYQIRRTYNSTVSKWNSLDDSWPGERKLTKLVEISNNLFIFAATMCRFINEAAFGTPVEQLDYILSHGTSSNVHAFAPTYLPVLERQIPKSASILQRKTITEQVHSILSAVIIVAEPLSLPALANLLGLDIATVESRLNSLRSVIEIDIPDSTKHLKSSRVRILHLSFRDFLIAPETQQISAFWVEEAKAHRIMAANSLKVLMDQDRGLKFNMVGLKSLGTPRYIVSQEHIDGYILLDVKYASVYLAHHLMQGNWQLQDSDLFSDFFHIHFLHWMEVLGFFEEPHLISRTLSKLPKYIHTTNGIEIKTLLQDAIEFMTQNGSILKDMPIGLYSSAVTHIPENNVIRQMLNKTDTSQVKVIDYIDTRRSLEFRRIHIKRDFYNGSSRQRPLILSPDENFILALFYQKGLAIWDMSGRCIMNNKSDSVAAFSNDSKLIVTGSEAYEVHIWNLVEAKRTKAIQVNFQMELSKQFYSLDENGCARNQIYFPLAFTPDDSSIITTSMKAIEIWSIAMGALVSRLDFNMWYLWDPRVTMATRTPVAAIICNAIYIWKLGSDRLTKIPYTPKFFHEKTLLSPDGDVLVSDFGSRYTVFSTLSGSDIHSVSKRYYRGDYSFHKDYFVAMARNVELWYKVNRGYELVKVIAMDDEYVMERVALSTKFSCLVFTTWKDFKIYINFWKIDLTTKVS